MTIVGYLRRHHVALLALLVALGGTSYAATQLPAKSVGTAQLKNKAVTLAKIKPATRDALRGQDGEDGQDGLPGVPGTAGQSATSVYGTAQLAVTAATTTYTLVPGLTQTFTVPAGATVLVSTDGGVQSAGLTGTFSVVDLALFVDGVPSTAAAQRRVSMVNSATLSQVVEGWSMSRTLELPAGSHTVDVRAVSADPAMVQANVSSGSAPQIQGQLTVVILKE